MNNMIGFNTYVVTYDISTATDPSESRGFQSQTNMMNLKTTVQARSGNDAQRIVESMFGGPLRCRAYGAIPIN